MPPRRLHIVCDQISGPPNIVLTSATTLYGLLEELQAVLPLPDDLVTSALHFLDPRSGGWSSPTHDLRDFPLEAHCRLFLVRNTNPSSVAALYCAVASHLMAALGPAAAAELRSSVREARLIAQTSPDGWRSSAAYEKLRTRLGAVDTRSAVVEGGNDVRMPSLVAVDRSSAAKSRPPLPASTSTVASPSNGHASPERSWNVAATRPTSAPAGDASSASPARAKTAASPMRHASLTTKGDDRVTLYFVYSGTTTQHAKALVTTRNAIDYDSIMTMLRAKFHTELSLGYLDDNGTAVEIQCTSDITNLLPSSRSTLTLQCWMRAPTSNPFEATSPTKLPRAVSPNTSLRSVTTPTKGVYGSRIGSAASRARSPSPAKNVPPYLSARIPDISGVLYTQDQLRELFDELDTDGSGALDKGELMRYFRTFDTMGILDAEQQFQAELDSCQELADGRVTFNEFAVMMLRIAQW